jgi:nucleotide-binding universal stress UspA family protein
VETTQPAQGAGRPGWPREPSLGRLLCVGEGDPLLHALERASLLPIPAGGVVFTLVPDLRGPAVEGVIGRLRAARVEVRHQPVDGALAADEAVLAAAERCGAELTLVSHVSKGGLLKRLLGSLPEHLVRADRQAVLVINRPPEGPYREVAVAVDLSEESRGAMEMALRLTIGAQARVRALHLYDTSYGLVLHQAGAPSAELIAYRERQRAAAAARLEEFLQPFRAAGAELETLLVSGDPTGEVAHAAAQSGADLIVLGHAGPHRASQAILASVAEATLRSASCDVLVIPSRQRRAP